MDARPTPVLTIPIEATTLACVSSSAIRAPNSLLAWSSRSMSSICFPRMPPMLLISSTARRTPLRMLSPIGLEPPVNGPVKPILIVSL